MDHSWGYGSDSRLRDENQDCHGVFEFPDYTLAVVCDGMGGHVGGAQASALAVRTIHDTLEALTGTDIESALSEAITRANQAIYDAARKNHRLMGMGTTVVAACITDERAYVAHVGDSRAYLLRGGQVQQITRDHTMVNLFVDAELLTPEDAATHPEAHVLSRSLGVERTVEVEHSDTVTLESDDVVFLCSDGVHGVITDWELGNVDWGAPNEGVQHVIDIVAARDGDDNATAVAVLLATSFEDVPPTPLPDLGATELGAGQGGLGRAAAPTQEALDSGRTIIPDALSDAIEEPPSTDVPTVEPEPGPSAGLSMPTPSVGGASPNTTPSYIVEDEPAPAAVDMPKLRKRGREQTDVAPPVAPAATDGAGSARRKRILLATAAMLLAFAGVGLLLAALLGGGGSVPPVPEPLEPLADPAEMLEAATIEPVLAPVEEPTEPAENTEDPEPTETDEAWVFRPTVPKAPRRLPHRSTSYNQPSPGGNLQWEAIQAARQNRCAEALDAVKSAMRSSIDHASLYSQAWFCFMEKHQRSLLDGQGARTWQDFPFVLDHFEGPPEQREREDAELEKLPTWYWPAAGGIEYRLDAWESSTREDKFVEVMSDLMGEPTLTDELLADVWMEASAAVGLSRVEDPNDKVVEWWARRVYVTSRSLNGRIGRLIEAHRPEALQPMRDMLAEATTPRQVEGEPPTKVPASVMEAYKVGMGLEDKPDPTRPKRKSGPVTPKEPDLDALDGEPLKVYR